MANQEKPMAMKSIFLIGALSGALAVSAGAQNVAPPAPPPPPPPALTADQAEEIASRLRQAGEDLADLQKRVEEIEQRLGDSFRSHSPFDTIERRLKDLEDDVDDLKRR
jgi:hypothetical protein